MSSNYSFAIIAVLLAMGMIIAQYMGIVAMAAPAEYAVAPWGNDSNAGSVSSPYLTLQKGLNAVRAGDTLTIRGGTYSPPSPLVLTNSGTAQTPITIRVPPDEQALIDGRFTLSTILDLRGVSYVVIDGLRFRRGGNAKGHSSLRLSGSSFITLRQLTISETHDSGIFIDASSRNVTVQGGWYTTSTTGIRVQGRDVIIDGVRSYGHNRMIENGEDCDGDNVYGEHGGQAIAVENSPGPVEIRNSEGWNNKATSICYGVDGAFVELFRSQNVFIHHNTSRDGVTFVEAAGSTTGNRIVQNVSRNEQFLTTHQANDMVVTDNHVENTLTARHTNPLIWIGSGGIFGTGSTANFTFARNTITTTQIVWQVVSPSFDPSATIDNNRYYNNNTLFGLVNNTSNVSTFTNWKSVTKKDVNSTYAPPIAPSPTPIPPTSTPIPPTSTPIPPTSTPIPPTLTPTPSPTSTLEPSPSSVPCRVMISFQGASPEWAEIDCVFVRRLSSP